MLKQYYDKRRRHSYRPQVDAEAIARKLRLLGCTEEQVLRHVAPLLKDQSALRADKRVGSS
jgi:hypothetical protein